MLADAGYGTDTQFRTALTGPELHYVLGIMSTVTVWKPGGLLAAAPKAAVKRLNGSALSPGGIDGTVLRLMSVTEETGVGITIFNNGKVAYSKAYGLRDVEKQLPLTEDSVMAGASLSNPTWMARRNGD